MLMSGPLSKRARLLLAGADRWLQRLAGDDRFLLIIYRWLAGGMLLIASVVAALSLLAALFDSVVRVLLAVSCPPGLYVTLLLGGLAVAIPVGKRLLKRQRVRHPLNPSASKAAPCASVAPSRRTSDASSGRTSDTSSRRTYDAFSWGDPPPTKKQFGYAMSLGAQLSDGMTK